MDASELYGCAHLPVSVYNSTDRQTTDCADASDMGRFNVNVMDRTERFNPMSVSIANDKGATGSPIDRQQLAYVKRRTPKLGKEQNRSPRYVIMQCNLKHRINFDVVSCVL